MSITGAIRRASTEHVVYFLLSAYVETLHHYDSVWRALPERVKRLPMAGKADVLERVSALGEAAIAHARSACSVQTMIREVAEVFCAALHRLQVLHIRAGD